MALTQRLHEAFKGAMERMTSPRTVSAFKEKGVLTPDEFVQAGDNLVSKCPTWSWEMGDPTKRKPYLPSEKQFLITRNVPCLRRVSSIEEEYDKDEVDVLLDNDDDGGFLAVPGPRGSTGGDESLPSMDTEEKAAVKLNFRPLLPEDDEDEDVPDMDACGDDNLVETSATSQPNDYFIKEEPVDDNILRTRTYDISITYDKYYQTPRVWLTGYDETRHLLQPELVLEDVSQDHARKTVTIEDHPHIAGKHASIHPCRHGAVMKKIIDILVQRGVDPEVDKYLFIFLKFVASVIPTIDYDYTVDFDLGGH